MAKDQIELFKNSLKSLDRVNDLLKNHKDNKEKILLDIYKLLIDKEPRIKSFKKVNINFLNEVLEIFFNNLNEISMSFYEAQNSLSIYFLMTIILVLKLYLMILIKKAFLIIMKCMVKL